MLADLYARKRVFLTGHTGFKGSWLAEWLLMLGAEVTGYSKGVSDEPCHFTALGLERRMRHILGDVRDADALERAVQSVQPDFVFHLAAQSLVRQSYREPVETMTTNIVGTVQVLDTLRRINRKVACVIVTSDKCYENREVVNGYREDDALGGHDPYSASKSATEIVAHSYRRSFFGSPGENGIAVATARAGNVIGGGDWSDDRIVPDCIRSLLRGEAIGVRNPMATRPWQHVLEPLSGYLWLGALLTGEVSLPRVPSREAVCSAFNFGPWPEANRSVKDLVTEILKYWPGRWQESGAYSQMHEAGLLGLSIDKAFHTLQWQPVWHFAQAVKATAMWYRVVAKEGLGAPEQTRADITAYVEAATSAGLSWAVNAAQQP